MLLHVAESIMRSEYWCTCGAGRSQGTLKWTFGALRCRNSKGLFKCSCMQLILGSALGGVQRSLSKFAPMNRRMGYTYPAARG